MQSRALAITNYFMLLVFLLCMVVQYNDPDSLIWMTMYGLAAITCVLSIRDKIHFSISIFIGFVGIVWALTLLPDVISSYSTTDNLFTWKMNGFGVCAKCVSFCEKFEDLVIRQISRKPAENEQLYAYTKHCCFPDTF